jgi:ankyrin repeat protein
VGHAIFFERYAAAALMLSLGFSATAPSLDGGSPLHVACWVGHAALVERLLAAGVPVDEPDPTHGSTPLGWTAFGSAQRRAKGGDYCAVIDRLADAGADIRKPGNRYGRTLVEMAEGNADVQAALRRRGASLR